MAFEQSHLLVAEAVFAVILNIWFLYKYWNRIMVLIRNKQMIYSLLFSISQAAVGGMIYVNMTYFSSKRMLKHYQQVEQENPNSICLNHLSDIFLDVIPDEDEDGYELLIGDHFPFYSLFLLCCFGVASCHLDIINTSVFIFACTMVLNSIAEQVTILPPSVGYARCKRRYGVTSAEDFSYTFGLAGTCAGLMWSGHTANVALMANGLSHALSRELVVWRRVMDKRFLFIRVHTYWVSALVIFQVVWLLLAQDHYTVDIFVGVCIMTLMLCSDQMEYMSYRINPFLKKLDFPYKSRFEAYGAYLQAYKPSHDVGPATLYTTGISDPPKESTSEIDVDVTVDMEHGSMGVVPPSAASEPPNDSLAPTEI